MRRLLATISTGEEVELVLADGFSSDGLSPSQIDDAVREAGRWVATTDGGGVRIDSIVRYRILNESGVAVGPPPPPPRPAIPTRLG